MGKLLSCVLGPRLYRVHRRRGEGGGEPSWVTPAAWESPHGNECVVALGARNGGASETTPTHTVDLQSYNTPPNKSPPHINS
uniref:Uncharacterized protein n=1 Tax=Coturnix japonica TaxID=93934 RepID=A0A8C2SP58_COTJA